MGSGPGPFPRVPACLNVQRVAHQTHTEWYVTGRPHSGASPAAGVAEVFGALSELLALQGIEPLQEKIYGLRRAHGAVLDGRSQALVRHGVACAWPVTVLEGTPASGAEFGGVQLWGVAPAPSSGQRVETVSARGRALGREWIGPDFRELVLAAVDGVDAGNPNDAAAPAQARRMFEAASAALSARGYSFRDVVRTWLYLSRLLDWYGDFNRVRTAHYGASGLCLQEKSVFPASTGIEGRHDREACVMDLLAVAVRPGAGLVVRPVLESERQGPPFAYGSAFARAMVIERGASKVVHVSGTASIDDEGRSLHEGDAAAQYVETLESIAALLAQEGGSLTNVCQGTLFAKTFAAAECCRENSLRLGASGLPLIEIVADVCRPELLVEIEAIAVI